MSAPVYVRQRGYLRGIHLSDGQEARLMKLAKELDVRLKPMGGGQTLPGWRALLIGIAEGKLEVRRAEGVSATPPAAVLGNRGLGPERD